MCVNVIHISPWDATGGLMRNAALVLPPEGLLYLYGPFRIAGVHTAPSNNHSTGRYRADETWGVRDLEDVVLEADKNYLSFIERIEMPANNRRLFSGNPLIRLAHRIEFRGRSQRRIQRAGLGRRTAPGPQRINPNHLDFTVPGKRQHITDSHGVM